MDYFWNIALTQIIAFLFVQLLLFINRRAKKSTTFKVFKVTYGSLVGLFLVLYPYFLIDLAHYANPALWILVIILTTIAGILLLLYSICEATGLENPVTAYLKSIKKEDPGKVSKQ